MDLRVYYLQLNWILNIQLTIEQDLQIQYEAVNRIFMPNICR